MKRVFEIKATAMLLGALLAAWPGKSATGEVVDYEITFDAAWIVVTHPQDFPTNPHFSGLIGATHNATVTFWQSGSIASAGIESMAETGSKTLLTGEINSEMTAGDAFSLVSGGGIFPSPGSVATNFQASSTHPLVTVVSMIAPSPDWFVGVSGLNLRDNLGRWRDNVVVNLDPYDAGTDDGVTFRSTNADTQPPIPISNLSNTFPFVGTPPMGTFTFRLLTPAPLPGDLDGNSVVDLQDSFHLANCLAGPNTSVAGYCDGADVDGDGDVDIADGQEFQLLFGDLGITCAGGSDLRLQISGAPESASLGELIDWTVEVRNVGDATSESLCLRTGVNCLPGLNDWTCNLGLEDFNTPMIAPGGIWSFTVTNYPIPIGALQQEQFIKVNIEAQQNCPRDMCSIGDFVQLPISIQ